MTKKTLIAYHSNCSDGKMAAFVAWKYFDRQADTVPVNYELHKLSFDALLQRLVKELPADCNLKQYTLMIVDFSFPPETLLQLASVFEIVVMLDHHHSAMQSLTSSGWTSQVWRHGANSGEDLIKYNVPVHNLHVYFCMGQSGALMTWHYFYGDDCDPADYIKFTSDRDLFKFLYKDTRNFASGIAMHRHKSWPDFESLLQNTDRIISDGSLIEQLRDSRIADILSKKPQVWHAHVDGHEPMRVGVYNAPADITSDLLAKYIQTNTDDVKIGMTYTIGTDNMVYCSLRSAEGVNCSVVATALGGGGHQQACGFTVPVGRFFLMLHSGSLTDHLKTDYPVPQWGYRRYGSPPDLGYTLLSHANSSDSGTPIAYLGDSQDVHSNIDSVVQAHNNELSKYFL